MVWSQRRDLIAAEDFLHVITHLPIFPDFREKVHYTNWMYSSVGRLIEQMGGEDSKDGWGRFIKRRNFEPMQMLRSTSNRDNLPDDNFTEPHRSR